MGGRRAQEGDGMEMRGEGTGRGWDGNDEEKGGVAVDARLLTEMREWHGMEPRNAPLATERWVTSLTNERASSSHLLWINESSCQIRNSLDLPPIPRLQGAQGDGPPSHI